MNDRVCWYAPCFDFRAFSEWEVENWGEYCNEIQQVFIPLSWRIVGKQSSVVFISFVDRETARNETVYR